MLTWILMIYFLGIVLMWAFIELLDDADNMRRHLNNKPPRDDHGFAEKLFLCCIWPIFSLIYIYMENQARKET